MLIDRLDNKAALAWLPPPLQRALDFLRTASLHTLRPGRQDIDGNRLFAIIQDSPTRPGDECAWEAHQQYIDLQYVVSGIERIGYEPLSHARELVPYDAAQDVTLFEPGSSYVAVRAGMLAIFWPDDVHAPGGAAGAPARVRKVVVKVSVSE